MSSLIHVYPIHFARYLLHQIDWNYFKLALLFSGMYIFDMLAMASIHGNTVLSNSAIYVNYANIPVMTIVYLGALFEFLGMKILVKAGISRLRKRMS